MKTQSKMTQLILQQPVTLTNKQVAELLGTTADCVRLARYRYGLPVPKRDKGYAEKIAAKFGCNDAKAVAAEIGCSPIYVRQVWRQIRDAAN